MRGNSRRNCFYIFSSIQIRLHEWELEEDGSDPIMQKEVNTDFPPLTSENPSRSGLNCTFKTLQCKVSLCGETVIFNSQLLRCSPVISTLLALIFKIQFYKRLNVFTELLEANCFNELLLCIYLGFMYLY